MIRIWVCLFLFAATKADDSNETEIVIHSVTKPPQVAMCGTRLYLVAKDLCCQGDVILPRPNEHIQCCGGARFDSRFYICCGEFVVFGKHGACCKNTWGYDDRTHLCCGGKLTRKPHPLAFCCDGNVCVGPAQQP